MYVPRSLQFAEPMFALWRGHSGRTYEFAVLSSERPLIAAPVVFVLARQKGGQTEALFIGHADRIGPGDGLDAKWIAAREMGMTHVHVSFDALWEPARAAQVADMVAALSPPLNASESEADAPAPVAAEVYRLPIRSRGSRDDAAGAAPGGASPLAEAERADGRASSPLQRRIAVPSERLRAIVRAAARTIERLVSRVRRDEGAAPNVAADAATPVAPSPAEEIAVVGDDVRLEPLEETQPLPDSADDGRIEAPADDRQPTAPAAAQSPETVESIRARLDLPPAAPVVLFAGHMAEASGIEILIDAIITVASGQPDAHFVLAGSGSLRAAAEARAAAAQLGGRCRFTGDLDPDACRDYLTAADFVVVPAHAPSTDGFAEAALTAGRPVLTTHQAQLPAVCHGVNGLVAYDNPNSLVWGLRELLGMRAEHRLLFETPRRVA